MKHHSREYGFTLDRPVIVDDIRVRAIGKTGASVAAKRVPAPGTMVVASTRFSRTYFEGGFRDTPVFDLREIATGAKIVGEWEERREKGVVLLL